MSTASSCADFVYLASASPRRRELLGQLGVKFRCLPQSLDESRRGEEAPLAYVRRLAEEKADAAMLTLEGRKVPVLGADTAVVCGSEVLGKPSDSQQAVEMLMALSGRWHRVVTGVALRYKDTCDVVCTDTRVQFCQLSQAQARAYVASGEPLDKAGSYGIQGLGGRLVTSIEGSYSGVVGLPLVETEALLQRAGVLCRW